MEIFTNAIIQYVAEILAVLIVTAIGIFGNWLLAKLNQKKGLENISFATEQVLLASQQTVLELQQTLVDGWKRAQDGKLTAEQVEELKTKVITLTMAKLADPTLKLLEGAKVDVTTMIVSAAEGYVLELKKN